MILLLKDWMKWDLIDKILSICVLIMIISTFIATYYEPIGNDAAYYHLYIPKTWIQEGRIFYDINHPRSLWPGFSYCLFAGGMLTEGGDPTKAVHIAKWFSWMFHVLTILLVPTSVMYFMNNKLGARYSTIFIAFIPAIWQQSLSCYTDGMMMFFSYAYFLVMILWERSKWSIRGAVIAGCFLAALVSIKYYTLIHAGIITSYFMYRLFTSKQIQIYKLKDV